VAEVPPIERRDTSDHPLPRGRHGLPPGFVSHNQRARLLFAIPHVTSEKGFVAMTVEDVVSRAGVSRKTFYEHFVDKEDAFLAAFDAACERIMDAVTSAYLSGQTWQEQLRLALRMLLGSLTAEPQVTRMCIVEVLSAGRRAQQRRAAMIQSYRRFSDAAMAHAPAGVPPVTTHAVAGGIAQLIYNAVVSGRADQLPSLLPQIVYFCFVPIVGPREAAREARRATARDMTERPT
jgi:AcrR family transcriptional regulator